MNHSLRACCYRLRTSSGRRALRCLWWLLSAAVLAAIPGIFWIWMCNDWNYDLLAWIISGLFVLLATPMTVYQVAMHYENYTKPEYQRRIIRILWMVPVYGLCSWLSLRFRYAIMYLDTIREFYEAFVIYNFYMFLITFLQEAFGPSSGSGTEGDPRYGSLPKYLEDTRGEVPHIWPLNYVFEPVARAPNEKEHPFFRKCKNGVMAYVWWRVISAVLAFYTNSKDLYISDHHPGRLDRFYIWLAVTNSATQCWAMYCLVWLYVTMHDELEPAKPLLKFICVKAIVFFSFWQSIVLMLVVNLGILEPSDLAPHRSEGEQPTKTELSTALNNVLICCEMFLAALAHANAFPAREYYPADPLTPRRQHGIIRNMWDMFNVWDVFQDTTDFGGDMVLLGGGALRDTTVAAVNIGVRGTRNVAQTAAQTLPVLKNFQWSSRAPNHQDPAGNDDQPLLNNGREMSGAVTGADGSKQQGAESSSSGAAAAVATFDSYNSLHNGAGGAEERGTPNPPGSAG